MESGCRNEEDISGWQVEVIIGDGERIEAAKLEFNGKDAERVVMESFRWML
jgi:hypothetical protein